MSTIQGSAFSHGLTGVHRGMNNLRRDAQEIANAGIAHSSSPDKPVSEQVKNAEFERPLVGLIEDNQQVSASVEVIKTQSEMIGSLLNEMA